MAIREEVCRGRRRERLPEASLDRRLEAAMFDWDGTAVPDRRAPAERLRRLVEALSALGFDLAVVSGTHIANVDGRLRARPAGPGRLYLCLNRGSEVFEVGRSGPVLRHRRVATPGEEAALDAAAELTRKRLAERGLCTEVVSQRLNRRKVDLIPEPEWADPPKARIDALLAAVQGRLGRAGLAGLSEVVELARQAAAESGLGDARVTSDAKHVEIGLTDKSDSARWILGELWRRGIDPAAVLIAGDELGPLGGLPGSDSLLLVPEAARATAVSVGVEPLGVPPGVIALGGGPDRFLSLLDDQLDRRRRLEAPHAGGDPGWTLAIEGLDPELERVHEALLTLADGRIGTSGSPVAAHPAATPSVLAAGIYDGEGSGAVPLPCPLWAELPCRLADGDRLRRVLDLRAGLLRQELELAGGGRLAAVLFSSLARPGTVALRAEAPAETLRGRRPLAPPRERGASGAGELDGCRWLRVDASSGGAVAVASEASFERTPHERLDRLAVYRADHARRPSVGDALADLRRAEEAGYERLLTEHRCAWALRWHDADVVVEGDPELQQAIRLALFHLMASATDSGEAAVGARGLSGLGYRGHVFWDSDVFVLPFLAATHPGAARAMLEYRVRRLPAARAAARALGRRGARFPWESARTGEDVTPPSTRDRTGAIVPIRTGELEEHVVADVAWGLACYLDWTGDDELAAGPGRELLVETARYWASRVRAENGGAFHIYGVIGPDEYHEPVDDNAYTNVMARWNLRRAAEAPGVSPEERGQWLEIADGLVDGYDPVSGLYEQFAGFYDLEPLIVEDLAARPVAADALLGRERVQGAQVVKQADVLMLHQLVPDEAAPGSLVPNLDFYEPRTSHGSSLSPGIHASLFARAGRTEHALEALRLTSRIDLDDLTQTTAAGLHLAAMGSFWQALAFGFAGLRPAGEALELDPRLPSGWAKLELRVRFRGRRVVVGIEPEAVTVQADGPLALRLGGSVVAAPITVPFPKEVQR